MRGVLGFMSTFMGHIYEFKVKKINRILDGDTIDATLARGVIKIF